MRVTPEHLASFPGSSAVEQPAVNRLVAGSNPARGAKQKQALTAKSDVRKSTARIAGATFGATFCKTRLTRLQLSAGARCRLLGSDSGQAEITHR
jgi:hypothetical protein